MDKKSSFFSALALVIAAAFALPACKAAGEHDKNPQEEPAPELVSTFAVLSDVHMQIEDKTAEQNFIKAMNICKREAGEAGLDGVMIAGDLLDPTWYGTLYYGEALKDNSLGIKQNNATRLPEIEYLKTVFEANIPQGTELIYTLGNHDMATFTGQFGLTYTASEKYREILASSSKNWFASDVSDEANAGLDEYWRDRLGCHYQRVGNVNFISIDVQKYWVADGAYSVNQLNWVRNTLGYISSTYPDENVVIITHEPVFCTVPGSESESWSSRDLAEILKDYPKTITVTGHIHESTYAEFGITQDAYLYDEEAKPTDYFNFMALEACSVKYTTNRRYDENGSYSLARYAAGQNASQGHIMRVYDDGSVAIERWDFFADRKAGKDWTLPALNAQDRLTKYTRQNRSLDNKAPYFGKTTTIEVCAAEDNKATLYFGAAEDDDNIVWAYKVKINRTAGASKELVLDPGYSTPVPPEFFTVTIDDAATVESVELYAEDALYAKSETIVISKSDFKAKKPSSQLDHNGSGEFTDSLNIGGVPFDGTPQFYTENGVLTNYHTGQAQGYQPGVKYFDAFTKAYSLSFRISDLRVCKAYTASGYALSHKRFGACVAAREFNGLIYGIHAYFDFGGVDSETKEFTQRNRVLYILTVNVPGTYVATASYELSSRDLTTADAETLFGSSEGATVKFERDGATVRVYLGETLESEYTLPSNVFKGNGYYAEFTPKAKGAVGIASYGGEANVSDVVFTLA